MNVYVCVHMKSTGISKSGRCLWTLDKQQHLDHAVAADATTTISLRVCQFGVLMCVRGLQLYTQAVTSIIHTQRTAHSERMLCTYCCGAKEYNGGTASVSLTFAPLFVRFNNHLRIPTNNTMSNPFAP